MLLVDDHITTGTRTRTNSYQWLIVKLLLSVTLVTADVRGHGGGSGGGGDRVYEETAGYQGNLPYKHTARCYSCMSKLYEAVWPSLSHIYKRPRNFSDDCNDDRIAEGRVPIVHCPTICVSLFEQPNIAGVRIKGYIRGCMSDVLIGGFNQTIVSWYRWMHRDSCRPYRKKDLFKLGGDSPDDSTIDVCTCYADHCNGNPSAHPHPGLLPLSILLMLLTWLFF